MTALLLPLAGAAWAQSEAEAAAAVAAAIDSGGVDLLSGVLGGGGGASGVLALIGLAIYRGWIKLPARQDAPPPPPPPPADAGPSLASQIADLHRVGMRRGDNDALHWPATIDAIHARLMAVEAQNSVMVSSITAMSASLLRVAQAMEAREGKRGAHGVD